MNRTLSMLVAALAFGAMAHAQDSTTTTTTTNSLNVKASDMVPKEETQKDIDQEITNNKLRAELGSKSKWSVKTALSYSGGSVERPMARIRPNYQAAANTSDSLTTLGGTVGIKYSVTKRDSISLSTGVLARNPFHGDLSRSEFDNPLKSGRKTDRYNVSTPTIDWTRAYKAAGMQMITSTSYSHATTTEAVRDFNQIGAISLEQTMLASFEGSGWETGLAFALSFSFYRDGIDPEFAATPAGKGAKQDDFSYAAYPFAEYAFNDKLSFRTVFGYFNLTHYRGSGGNADQGAVDTIVPYQSVGLGYSVTRDIYLYPNIQFTPLDIRADRTNVAFSANINVF